MCDVLKRWRIGVGAGLTAFAIACSAPSDSPTAGPPTHPLDQFLQVGDVSLHYLDWGGDGDLLLMVPGLTATAYVYSGIAPAFADSYHVVAMTRRGHGDSGALGDLTPGLDLLADDIAAVIDHFTDEDAILVGHSYAGVEIPGLAARHPDKVRAVLFLDAVYDWPGWLEPGPPPPGFGSGAPSYPSVEAAQDWYLSQFPEFESPVARAYVRSQVRETPEGDVAWHVPVPSPVFTAFLNVYAEWSGEEYSSLTVPVLSLRSAQEKFMSANLKRRGFTEGAIAAAGHWAREFDDKLKEAGSEMLAEIVPHAMLLTFDSTHHMLQLQRPEEVVAAMRDFLDGLN